MDIRSFTVTSVDDPGKVVAVGISIVREGGDEEAVTYRRDPITGQSTFSVSDSPEEACRLWSRVVPAEIVWLDEHPTDAARCDSPRCPWQHP